MQSISGSGNAASTPIKTITVAGPHLLLVRNPAITSGGISVAVNGVQVSNASAINPRPAIVPVALEAGDAITYSVGYNNGSPWSFDFELFDLTATAEIG